MERRQDQRHEDQFLIAVVDESDEHTEPCRLKNISTGGLALEFPRATPDMVSTHLIVEIPLGRSVSRLRTRCEVRAVSQDDDVPTAHLQFLDDSPLFRGTLDGALAIWNHRQDADPLN